ncbi:gluconokinase [Sanguibacter suaedae]|uniref:Gluconokinase n=1 Tax=Sanguibacter suaedae TaxID=2795737 RepID=A0A934I4Y1_9MICO|nr:gluconokinase [Sanguibacter suaedae]MBI9115293.1 gluconokinase [Sanguibacter suaedae]
MAPDDATARPQQDDEIQHLVVMGVSGSGKTTLATNLSERLGWPVAEADTFHPPENIAKMTAGTPLTDEDRWPWLDAIRDWLTSQAQTGRSTIVTCSALRRAYRDVLGDAQGRVRFLHVTAAPEVIGERLSRRSGHFMPPTLLPSQLSTLEPLTDDEDGTTLAVDVPPDVVMDRALEALGLTTES